MNKSEMADALATRTGLNKNKALEVVCAIFDEDGLIAGTLKKGGDVAITGFGTFKVNNRAARTAMNPITKAKMQVAAKRVPKFSAGKNLKSAVA
jgi:DNA-binding protein HU-beta